MDFWPQSVHFRRGPPTIFRKHMPWGMGTKSLGMIGCIFAENGPLEGGIESNSGVPAGVLRVNSDGFLASIRAFSKGAPHHFPKAHALRYGHKKFGNDRMYIRGEWALRRWHWIEFWGTRGGAKGDFRWIFGLNPCIFRKHMPWGMGTEILGMIGCIFAENGPLEGGIESNSGVPAGVLRVISDGFLASIRAFSKGAPHHFPKAHALRYGHKKFGNDRMYIRGEWALRRWHWIEFWGTRGGAKGEFRWIFGLNPCIFEGGPPPFSESTCPEVWVQKVWEWSDVYSRRMGP